MATTKLGRKIRALRRKEGITQAALAGKLGISASYLNLLEHDRRPLSAALLIKLAELFQLDLGAFAGDDESRLMDDLSEAFGDPLFEDHPVVQTDLQELLVNAPDLARAVLHLFNAYQSARDSAQDLAERVIDGGDASHDVVRAARPTDEVSDFIEHHSNHFPDLEEAAERLWSGRSLEVEDLFGRLTAYIERAHGVRTRIEKDMPGMLRRFDPQRKELELSVLLRRGSRNFQLASTIGSLECGDIIDQLIDDPRLTSDATRKLARVALLNYFAAALLMPYRLFLTAAREERYDLDLLTHRFRASFEQVCHRLTTMHRSGDEGVPFHFVRVDMAGNVSKVLGESGIRFPRFSGLCPLWNVHAAFQRPGAVRVQISELPDGTRFFSVAKTVRKHRGGYHAPNVLQAIGLGCDLESARQLVYADGMDLTSKDAAVPVGMTCRLCERLDCQARAFPPVQMPMAVDENVRGITFYARGGKS